MNKLFILPVLVFPLMFASCSSSSSSSSEDVLSGINEFSLDYESFKTTYGTAKLTLNGVEVSDDNGVYYLDVTNEKQVFELTGYFDGRIVIQNPNSLTTYKAVTLNLNKAFIVSNNEATIDYTLENKTFDIYSINGTTNYVVNSSKSNYDGHAINAMNNFGLYIEDNSTINVYSAHGHTIKADGDVKVGGTGNVYLSSGHDGIHCHNFSTSYGGTNYSGTFTINNSISQAIEASKSSGEGVAYIYGGEFIINNAESVFKVDATIRFTGGSLSSTGIWATPFVRGGSSELSLIIGDGISVVVNGTAYQSQTF